MDNDGRRIIKLFKAWKPMTFRIKAVACRALGGKIIDKTEDRDGNILCKVELEEDENGVKFRRLA